MCRSDPHIHILTVVCALAICLSDSIILAGDALRTLAADERRTAAFPGEKLERARSLPERLKHCFELAHDIRKTAGAARGEQVRAKEDELTEMIKKDLVVPRPRPFAATDPGQAALKKKDIGSFGKGLLFVVGYDGYIGRRHLASSPTALSQCEGQIQLLGGMDLKRPSPETIELFQAVNHGAKPEFFTTFEQALERAKDKYDVVDPSKIIVIIATPDHVHFQNIKELARHGVKRFIVEKPIGRTPEEIAEIIAFARQEGLTIAGVGQVFTSDVADKIKKVMERHGFKPARYLLYWTKDRTERSLSGENMGEDQSRTNTLAFDFFHQLGAIDMLDKTVGIIYAYTRDMAAPGGRVFKDHGLGVAFARHESGAESLCVTSFTEDGRYRPNQKTINIVGEDGSVIVADVASDDEYGETVMYRSREGEVEIYPVNENTTTMLAKAQVELLSAVVAAPSQPAASLASTSLDFHRHIVDFMGQAALLAEINRDEVFRKYSERILAEILYYGVYNPEEIRNLLRLSHAWFAGNTLTPVEIWQLWSFLVVVGCHNDEKFESLAKQVQQLVDSAERAIQGTRQMIAEVTNTGETEGVFMGYGFDNSTLDNDPFRDDIIKARDNLLKEQIHCREGEIVLDLGCGGGEVTVAFAETHPEVTMVVGIDASPHNIREAIESAKRKPNLTNVKFYQRDFRTNPKGFPLRGLPMPDHSVDRVLLLTDTFEGQRKNDIRSAWMEIIRVLKFGGEIVFFGQAGVKELEAIKNTTPGLRFEFKIPRNFRGREYASDVMWSRWELRGTFWRVYPMISSEGTGVSETRSVDAVLNCILRQVSFGERRNVALGNNVAVGKDVTFTTEGSGTIEIHDGARIENGVQLEAKDGQRIVIGRGTTLLAGLDTIIEGNVIIGENCEISGRVTDAKIGDRTRLHDRAVVTMAELGNDCHINGAKVKNSKLGRGVTVPYRSICYNVVAHDEIPLLNDEGGVEVLDLGANCSRIEALKASSVHLLGPSFIDSGAVIVGPSAGQDIPLKEIYEQNNITVIGPFCYVVNRIKGAVLPFTKAGERTEKIRRGKVDRTPDVSPRFHDIGWVLDNYTGMILNRLARFKKYANPEAFDSLVERTLAHSINLVKRELAKPKSRYDRYKLMRGLEIYEAHLRSGAWKMKDGNFAWGGRLERGQDFGAIEKEIKRRVRSYREQKRRERFKPIGTWIEMFKNKTSPQLENGLMEIYGDRPEFIEERRVVILTALEEAAKIFTLDREVCIVRSPARINLCGRGNQDAEDGHMNFVAEGRENVMVVARRENDSGINLHNATPRFKDQQVSFNIAREVENAQSAWYRGWNDYINDDVVKMRVEEARSNDEAEWVNVPRGAILNLIHELGDIGLFHLNVDINGFEALVYSDIPPGGGISSSSALAVSSAMAFLEANLLSCVPAEVIAELPYETYTGELGGNGDHAAIILAQCGSIVHLSQMNSTGRPNARYIKISDDLQIAIVPSFVSSRKTGEQKIENNKGKFSFKLAVPVIKKILRELQPQYPKVISDDFIERFGYIGQLNRDTLGPDYEVITYQILRRLPEGMTTEQLINVYPYPELRPLSEKFELTERKLTEFEEKVNKGKLPGEYKHIPRDVDLKGPVLFFLAMAERARMFGEYLDEAERARQNGDMDRREELLRKAGELMYIGHDGDRAVVYDAATGATRPYEARRVTDDMLEELIAKRRSGEAQAVEEARLYRQSGYFRASIEELDTIVDVARSLGDDVVLGATVTGAGFGGNAVVLMRKRAGTFDLLAQALGRAGALRVAREQYAHAEHIEPETLPFARLNVPVGGAGVFEVKTNYAGGVDTLAVNREALADV